MPHDLLHQGDALPVLPNALGFGVDPGKFGEGMGQTL